MLKKLDKEALALDSLPRLGAGSGMNLNAIAGPFHPERNEAGEILRLEVPLEYDGKQTIVSFELQKAPLPADTDLAAFTKTALYELAVTLVPLAARKVPSALRTTMPRVPPR